MTKITRVLTTLASAAVAVAMAAAGGCSKDVTAEQKGRPGDRFLGPGEVSPVSRIVDRQIAAGARTDSTLRPYHFDGPELNTLGCAKLDSMVIASEDAATPAMVVYVDLPHAETDAKAAALAGARRDAVGAYLVELGLAEDEFRLESGYNPDVTTSVVAAKPPQTGAPAASAADEGFGKGLGDAMGTKK